MKTTCRILVSILQWKLKEANRFPHKEDTHAGRYKHNGA